MRKFKGDKCPTCGTEFITDMCPTQVARRFKERAKRSRAAKKGWNTRRAPKENRRSPQFPDGIGRG